MGIDYGEILCTAVDEIITARMSGLAYDITKLCTIVDDTNSYQGKYVVSDGTARYEAYSTDNNLKKGNSVLVTIPNGDYSMQKIIKGRVAATDTTPFRYTSPLDTMISIKSEFTDTVIGENQGLTANDSQHQITDAIYSIGSTQALTGISGFTRLGVSANFKSLLNNFDVVSGSYGIKLVVYSEIIDKPGSKKDAVYVLDFNSADMIGNPYQFEDFFSQEKVFDISYINRVKRVDAYFYQGNNFIDGNGEKVPFYVSTGEGFEGIVPLPHNLFVDGIKVYLGYDKNEFKDETLMIYTDDSLSYHYSLEGQENKPSENRKTVQLRWIHKVNENEFTLITNNDIDNKKYEVNWFRYSPGWENVDKYAGKNWEKINVNITRPMECQFNPDITKQKEEIKAIGIIRDGSQVSIDGKTEDLEKAYVSNLLTFENEEEVPDNKTWEASSALQIRCEDDSEGNYYIYNQNGKINNQGIGQGYIRYLKAYYKGAEITSDLGSLDYIKWYIPAEKSMMIYTDALGKENDGNPKDDIVFYKQVNYKQITREPNKETGLMNTTQGYSIGNQWTYQNSNNTVRCQVSIDGVIYEAAEELRFGKSGTNGTNVTLVLELEDNANALVAAENKEISVRLWMYNEEGVRSGFTGDAATGIEWSWYKDTIPTKDKDGNTPKENEEPVPYMSIKDGNTTGVDHVTIKSNINYVPKDNYFILQAIYNNLTAYLPIPLKSANTSFIEGAREIIYDHQGIPSYYNDVYNLYYLGEDGKYVKVPSLSSTTKAYSSWDLTCDEEAAVKESSKIEKDSAGNEIVKNEAARYYFPTLKDTKYGKALSAASFYARGYSDKVCVKGSYIYSYTDENKENKSIIYAWSQPILIMQSRYDFAMLNDWDGNLTLDEGNGTILSTMLGAGRKDSKTNAFSGVLIGDIQQGTGQQSASSLTGVYGLQDGVISYSLTEDGKATFGKKNKGQIIIDGKKSTIQSAGYSVDSNQGTLIDLDDGFIEMKYPDKGKIKLSSKDAPYFLVQSSSGKSLINIGLSAANGSNFISSDDNSSGSVYLDLTEGSLDIKSTGVMNFLIDSTPKNNGDPCFKIAVPSKNETAADQFGNNLFYLSAKDFYLKSREYGEKAPKVYSKNEKKGNYYSYEGEETYEYWIHEDEDKDKQRKGNFAKGKNIIILNTGKIMLAEDDIDDKDNVLMGKEIELKFVPKIIEKTITVGTGENEKKYTIATNITEDMIEKSIRSSVSVKYDTNKDNEDTNINTSGFKLDLQNSKILGYDLYLQGTNSSDTTKSFLLDSGAVQYPFQVGNNCRIDWDGKIECKDISIGGKSLIQGETKISLGSFWVDGASKESGGYFGGQSAGVAGFTPASVTSIGYTILVS